MAASAELRYLLPTNSVSWKIGLKHDRSGGKHYRYELVGGGACNWYDQAARGLKIAEARSQGEVGIDDRIQVAQRG
jgi:hypothetical protein